jgi:chromosome segregation ATPase
MPKKSLSNVITSEINTLQHQLNHLIIAKDFKAKQEDCSVQLSDTIGDLKNSNDFMGQKISIFKENNAILDKANENLREKLLRYHKLTKQLESDLTEAENKCQLLNKSHSFIGSNLQTEENALRIVSEKRDINVKEVTTMKFEKEKLDRQLIDTKRELLENEDRYLEVTAAISAIEEREKHIARTRENTFRENASFERKINELRTQNDFLKSEVDQLAESLMQKELKNENLAKQREEMDTLAAEFYKLRINYTERLNEQVFARNMVIKRIMEDNSRLESLSHDADRTLSHIKNIF